MNCNQIKENTLDFIDGTLDNSLRYQFLEHTCSCHSCDSYVEYQRLLKNTLANMPAPKMPAGLENRLLEKIENETPVSQRKGFIAGFSTAIAASIAAWLVFSPAIIPPHVSPNSETLSSLLITQNTVNKVKLAFNAPDNFQQVTLSLSLPEGTELSGFPGLQQLSWNTTLKAGQNILTLPIVTRSSNGGVLEAKISSATGSKIIKVKMNISDNKPIPVEI